MITEAAQALLVPSLPEMLVHYESDDETTNGEVLPEVLMPLQPKWVPKAKAAAKDRARLAAIARARSRTKDAIVKCPRGSVSLCLVTDLDRVTSPAAPSVRHVTCGLPKPLQTPKAPEAAAAAGSAPPPQQPKTPQELETRQERCDKLIAEIAAKTASMLAQHLQLDMAQLNAQLQVTQQQMQQLLARLQPPQAIMEKAAVVPKAPDAKFLQSLPQQTPRLDVPMIAARGASGPPVQPWQPPVLASPPVPLGKGAGGSAPVVAGYLTHVPSTSTAVARPTTKWKPSGPPLVPKVAAAIVAPLVPRGPPPATPAPPGYYGPGPMPPVWPPATLNPVGGVVLPRRR